MGVVLYCDQSRVIVAFTAPMEPCLVHPFSRAASVVRRVSNLLFPKPIIFIACLIPLAVLAVAGVTDNLGANPIEEITHETGEWTLRFLLITLLMTPLRHWFGWGWPIRVRRMLGLFSAFYATLHLFTYLWLDQFFWWEEIWYDILDRPFITIGMLGFVLLIPLVLTSTNAMMRKLGRNWKKLHRLAYVIPALGVVHYWWLVKADIREPLLYAVLLGGLLGWRYYRFRATRPS